MSPLGAIADAHGHLAAMRFERTDTGEEVEVPMRGLYVAAGTSPNTIYQQEYPGTFTMDGKFFQRYEPRWRDGNVELEPMHDTLWPKIGRPAPLTSYRLNGKFISFYGDNHPVYAGNVVKAMASAKHGYPWVVRVHEQEIAAASADEQPARDAALQHLFARLDDELAATVVAVNRLTPTIVEVVARAPLAAKGFEPGRFYRVQNFEADACTSSPARDAAVSARPARAGFAHASAPPMSPATASPTCA
jgi:hypothetical protein